jgi:hypothetical protein
MRSMAGVRKMEKMRTRGEKTSSCLMKKFHPERRRK